MTGFDAWWEREEHRQFGRDPSTDDLLDRHLRRVGARDAINQDPAAHFQVAMLRDFLRLLRAALDDEHVNPDVARRVIERVIYGGAPNPAAVELTLIERRNWAEQMKTMPLTIWTEKP